MHKSNYLFLCDITVYFRMNQLALIVKQILEEVKSTKARTKVLESTVNQNNADVLKMVENLGECTFYIE